jgi:hypothetical protein
LGKDSKVFEPAAALCEESVGGRHRRAQSAGAPTLAQQLDVECADDAISDADCVPNCSEELRGFLMLLNIEGDDSKLHRGLYSWVGAATDGGYIGADIATFTSSVISAAPGTFVVVLMLDAGILAALTIQRDQKVAVSGDRSLAAAPSWGSGAFVLQQDASLSLIFVSLEGAITLEPGATALMLRDCANTNVITGQGVSVPTGTTFTIQATTPTTLVLGVVPMDGHLVIRGPIVLSNANILSIASTAFGGASVTVGGGVTCYLPNQLVPVLEGSMPGTLMATVDGQTVGTLATAADGTVSSVPLGWYTTLTVPSLTPGGGGGPSSAAESMWDSGDLVNANGNTFSLYLATPSAATGHIPAVRV